MYFIRKNWGFFAGLITIVLFLLFNAFPSFLEFAYTMGFYKMMRYFYRIFLFWVPIPLIYVFFVVVIFIIVRQIIRNFKGINQRGIINFTFHLAGILITLFYFLWGFNYARKDFDKRINITISNPDSEFLFAELESTDSLMLVIRSKITKIDTLPLNHNDLKVSYQSSILQSQKKVIRLLREPIFPKAKVRELKPSGVLLRIKTAGVYFPFALEGHIDNGLHPIEKPYVYAHELAHVHAFTDEGVANFIGLLTCINAEDPFVQYSGWMEYYGYIYRTLKRNHLEILEQNEYEIPESIKRDYNAIISQLRKYPDIFPAFRDLFYDKYLKVQGVKSGLASYSDILKLSHSYILKEGSLLIN